MTEDLHEEYLHGVLAPVHRDTTTSGIDMGAVETPSVLKSISEQTVSKAYKLGPADRSFASASAEELDVSVVELHFEDYQLHGLCLYTL
jgi:hypothetical protein